MELSFCGHTHCTILPKKQKAKEEDRCEDEEKREWEVNTQVEVKFVDIYLNPSC